MNLPTRLASLAVIALSTSLALAQEVAPADVEQPIKKDVPYVPTPEGIVDAMLDLAKVGPNDVVYDLGSGDGRIVIAAARRGARGVGIDIDPERIREANANAEKAGVTGKVKFIEGDLFEADISDATVVTMYLLTDVNLKLRPKLMAELKPGTRIVSQTFDMGEWEPQKTTEVGFTKVYYWTIPAQPLAFGPKPDESLSPSRQ
jgi:SAM-dependent methyltransferase